MNVEVTRLPESRVTLKIELSPDEVDQALERTYKQLVQRVNIPGFRKGKAPRSVLERLLGPESFLHEGTDEAVRWGYRKALDQENLAPLDQADIDFPGDDHSHLQPGEAFRFEATVAVKPDVDLPDYHSIEVEVPQVEVTDEDLTEVIQELRNRDAALEPVTRPAQIGDVITMNVTARVGGDEVVNDENADYELLDAETETESSTFPGLSKELVDARPGDIREVTLSLPEDYPDAEQAGKTMFLRILVKEVKRKVLPEVDDEFAQSVSQFETIDALRDALRQNIQQEKQLQADQQVVRASIEALASRTFIEIPPVMIDEELDRMIDELRTAFERQGTTLDFYFQTTGKTEQDLRNDMRDGAAENVKTSLVLGALADAEQIEVSNREVDAELDALFRGMRVSERERRQLRSSTGLRSNFRNRIRRQRAIRKLVQIVTGEEISAEAAESASDETPVPDSTEENVPVEIGG